MSVISELLQKAREALQHLDESDTTFAVIGNESCDLDSACCSIALAHFLSVKNPDNPSVPLLNCHREDLPLRQDIIWLMQHIGIDHTQFVHYPEEFNPSEAKNLKVTLVDHNVPDEMLRPHTVEIIDHHEDAQTIQCPRVIEGVGSCATLVAERLLDDEEYEMTKDIATLLLSAILADTANLVAEGRTTDKDRFVASRLEGLVTVTPDELYNKISSARYNITDLTTLQLLRADFKQSQAGSFHLGFCTVRSLMTKLVTERDRIEQDMTLFCNQNGLQLLVLLCIQMKPLQRQIALYQPREVTQDLVDSVAATLEANPDLQVERVGEGLFDGIVLEQGNSSVTRKQIIPIVTKCLKQGELEDSVSSGDHTPEPTTTTAEERKEEESHQQEGEEQQQEEEEEEVKTETEVSRDQDEGQEEKNEETKNKVRGDGDDEEEEGEESQRGSLLQLESISCKLGESMDSFALAQDSDQGGHSPGSSRTSSTVNVSDRLGSNSMERHEETRPPPPLEPIVDIVSPLDDPPLEDTPSPNEPSAPQIPEYTPNEELKETRDFRTMVIDGEERRINLKFIENYRNIIQHGGYLDSKETAVVVISACYLPSKQLHNYPQMISQLFFYVLSVLDKLVVDDYVIVYLHSGAPRNSMPGIQWFHKFYRMIDRRLRKNLKSLYIVHPTFWTKTMLRLARPFISRKFYRKVHYISSLKILSSHITLDSLFIPNAVQNADHNLNPEDYKAPPTSS